MNLKYFLKIFFFKLWECWLYFSSLHLTVFYPFSLFIFFQTWLTLENIRLLNGSVSVITVWTWEYFLLWHWLVLLDSILSLIPWATPLQQSICFDLYSIMSIMDTKNKLLKATTSKNCLLRIQEEQQTFQGKFILVLI